MIKSFAAALLLMSLQTANADVQRSLSWMCLSFTPDAIVIERGKNLTTVAVKTYKSCLKQSIVPQLCLPKCISEREA